MSDIQLDNCRDSGDGTNSAIGQAVTGMAFQPILLRKSCRLLNAFKLGLPLRRVFCVTICPCMNFNNVRADLFRGFNLSWVRFNKEGNAYIRSLEALDIILKRIMNFLGE